MHNQNSFEKDHVKELEFYQSLAKAASLANHNDTHSRQSHESHEMSPPASPQPMQIDTDVGEDCDVRDHLNPLSDAEDHEQQAKASASALAVAAAAAQAHLNGTSEYISTSNFIKIKKQTNITSIQKQQNSTFFLRKLFIHYYVCRLPHFNKSIRSFLKLKDGPMQCGSLVIKLLSSEKTSQNTQVCIGTLIFYHKFYFLKFDYANNFNEVQILK